MEIFQEIRCPPSSPFLFGFWAFGFGAREVLPNQPLILPLTASTTSTTTPTLAPTTPSTPTYVCLPTYTYTITHSRACYNSSVQTKPFRKKARKFNALNLRLFYEAIGAFKACIFDLN